MTYRGCMDAIRSTSGNCPVAARRDIETYLRDAEWYEQHQSDDAPGCAYQARRLRRIAAARAEDLRRLEYARV